MTTRIGHAHLKVRNLDRAVSFYQRFLEQRERLGDTYVFMSGTDVHHEIALQRVPVRRRELRERYGPGSTSRATLTASSALVVTHIPGPGTDRSGRSRSTALSAYR